MTWKDLNREKRDFIAPVAEAAMKDWESRRICLPSLVIALAVEGTDWGRKTGDRGQRILFPHRRDGIKNHDTIRDAVCSHNNYIAVWQGENQQEPNWAKLIGQKYYILAAQYLQEARYPYVSSKTYEKKIIYLIEEYLFMQYDL